MAEIFPFSRRQAESRVRAERKRVARESREAEERIIWNQLVDKQIEADRCVSAWPRALLTVGFEQRATCHAELRSIRL
jgi:hypothetical protein